MLFVFSAAQISVPLAILWGVLFSLLTLIYVWVLSPLLRVLEVVFAIFRRVRSHSKNQDRT
jgi:hypothetical protein